MNLETDRILCPGRNQFSITCPASGNESNQQLHYKETRMKILLTAVSVILMPLVVHGIEHNKVALQFHTVFDRYESTTEAGIRFYPFRRTGFEVSFGLSHTLPLHQKSYEDISPQHFPTNDLSCRYYQVSIGSVHEIYSRQQLIVSILAKGNLDIRTQEAYEYYYNSQPGMYDKISVEYTLFQPSLLTGFESSFYFSDRFCIYSDFGLTAAYIPGTKYIDIDNSAFNYWENSF